jgi:hypothetical protein
MTSATRRPRGTRTEDYGSWLDEPADVARPMLDEIAAQPRLQFLPAVERNIQGRAATTARTSARTTAVLATLATMAWLTGCSAAKSDDEGGVCLQAAAGQSSKAPAPDDSSTEGGGLSQTQGNGRARDVVPVPGLHETAGAGGAASNQESSGSDRAVRDRSGLVDAWPEVGPTRSHPTVRAGLSNG